MEATPVNVEIPNQEEKKVWDEKAINEFMEEQKKALKTCTHVWIGVLAYLLIIGIVACFIVYGVLMLGMFVVNLIFFLKTKKFLKSLEYFFNEKYHFCYSTRAQLLEFLCSF